jgi:hypothetical protein
MTSKEWAPMNRSVVRLGMWAALAILMSVSPAQAIIIYGGSGRDTNMPTLSGGVKPGWQYIGLFDSYTGVAIGPRAWVTATHVLQDKSIGSSNTLNYNSTNYASTLVTTSGDLAVYELNIDQPDFADWAPVWQSPGSLAVDIDLYMYGRGTNRGAARTGGWDWGTANTTLSWGTNNLTTWGLLPNDPLYPSESNNYIVMSFDQPTVENGLPDSEGIASVGDSSGPIFGFNAADNQWQLLGINTYVQTVAAAPNSGSVNAALYDATGYYVAGTPTQIAGEGGAPVPLSTISTAIPFKYNVLAPFIPVPEPSTWILAGLSVGGLALTTCRKRRGRKA